MLNYDLYFAQFLCARGRAQPVGHIVWMENYVNKNIFEFKENWPLNIHGFESVIISLHYLAENALKIIKGEKKKVTKTAPVEILLTEIRKQIEPLVQERDQAIANGNWEKFYLLINQFIKYNVAEKGKGLPFLLNLIDFFSTVKTVDKIEKFMTLNRNVIKEICDIRLTSSIEQDTVSSSLQIYAMYLNDPILLELCNLENGNGEKEGNEHISAYRKLTVRFNSYFENILYNPFKRLGKQFVDKIKNKELIPGNILAEEEEYLNELASTLISLDKLRGVGVLKSER